MKVREKGHAPTAIETIQGEVQQAVQSHCTGFGEVTYSCISASQPKTLTKTYRLGVDGKLTKSTVANLSSGVIEVRKAASVSEFARQLQELAPSQALTYGVPKDYGPCDGAPYQSKLLSIKRHEELESPSDAITRTNANFKWPEGAGVLLLDYDPQEGQQPLSKAQLLARLNEFIPLEQTAYVWWCSSSSLITNAETQEQLTGIKGQRVYIMVKNASDILRAGEVLFNRLWLAGHGYYAVSRAGSALKRSVIDASVWQPTRLDFAAGAHCSPPLKQERGIPDAHDGDLLDTLTALPDLTPREKVELKTREDHARKVVQADIASTRQRYIEESARDLVTKKHGNTLEGEKLDKALDEARNVIVRACDHHTLAGDFIITLADGERVSVGEVMDRPASYHDKLTLDPLEPEYNGHKVVGKLYLIGRYQNLYSFAHGGRNFRLVQQVSRIEHKQGADHGTTQETLERLRRLPDVFDMGTELVEVSDGKVCHLNQHGLNFYLGGAVQYWKWNKAPRGGMYEVNINPPQQVVNHLLAMQERRRLKPLKAVITAPVITGDGRVLESLGYDEGTQLYLDTPTDPLPVLATVDEQEALRALNVLMRPFRGFAFADKLDRSVLLALLLTAVVRPVLDTAPAGGLDAPVQGSGKTLLAQCIGALATGAMPSVYPHTAGVADEETRKRLTAILTRGELVVVWDNVLGHFDSAAVASFLTSPEYSDRILGKSETAKFPNRTLFLLTGNNLALSGDMPRRVLKCRLDAQTDNPAGRKFDFSPLREVIGTRQTLVRAALTLIRGYQQSDVYKAGGAVPNESTASFEQWDALVRQPCAWIAERLPRDYQDPAGAIREAIGNDPEKEELSIVLEGIKARMGEGTWVSARELFTKINDAFDSEPELRETLEGAMRTKLTAHALGRWLGYRTDRIVNGLRLRKRKRRDRLEYCVEGNFELDAELMAMLG
ncbi:putative phage associated protein [gamma proteobacterium HdN1]|nr:putative phage associated protein [gamma proteobacterium HdN1]